MFSARALPIVSLCHIDPSRKDAALGVRTSRTSETSPQARSNVRVTDRSDDIVLDTEAWLAHGFVFES